MNSSDTISILNDLIETVKDGQEGFRLASEDSGDAELKTLFNEFSLQRAKFAGELQQEVTRLGEADPEKKSSVAGALHRGWINLRAALSSKDAHSVLSECERGEDYAVDAYKKALESELPQNVRGIVERQSREVKAVHDRVKALRDARVK
ncbi:MAG: hypothetical protein QOD99_3241 [Chthoniobacter sp.]|jgi:uncharacterized protein (TIGR02284 family)|nr:hypothetical protein [Chthoniobacter sp.]